MTSNRVKRVSIPEVTSVKYKDTNFGFLFSKDVKMWHTAPDRVNKLKKDVYRRRKQREKKELDKAKARAKK